MWLVAWAVEEHERCKWQAWEGSAGLAVKAGWMEERKGAAAGEHAAGAAAAALRQRPCRQAGGAGARRHRPGAALGLGSLHRSPMSLKNFRLGSFSRNLQGHRDGAQGAACRLHVSRFPRDVLHGVRCMAAATPHAPLLTRPAADPTKPKAKGQNASTAPTHPKLGCGRVTTTVRRSMPVACVRL